MGIWRIAAFLLLGFLWGSEWIFTRDLEVPPLQAVAIRCGIAAVGLICVALIRCIAFAKGRTWLIAAITGVSMIALPAALTIWASARMTPGLLVVVLAMTPLIAALLEGRASGPLLPPLVGGIAGTALLASQGLSFSMSQLAGSIAALLAAASVAASVIVVKRQLATVDVVMVAAIQFAVAAPLLAATAWIFERGEVGSWGARPLLIETLLAFLGSALAFPVYYWILRQWESHQLTASHWLVTSVGVAEGLIFLHEAPSWRTVAGLAIGLIGLAMLLRTEQRNDSPLTIR